MGDRMRPRYRRGQAPAGCIDMAPVAGACGVRQGNASGGGSTWRQADSIVVAFDLSWQGQHLCLY
eukprot:13760-Pyramimonas_sp.AAC.1